MRKLARAWSAPKRIVYVPFKLIMKPSEDETKLGQLVSFNNVFSGTTLKELAGVTAAEMREIAMNG